MKTVERYVANDGTEFADPQACLAHERLQRRVDALMAPLGEVPALVKDGKGWLQHNPAMVVRVRDSILDLACEEMGLDQHFPVFKSRGPKVHPLSIIGRILDDYSGPINKAWDRFCRIDPQGREHQQPFYAYTGGVSPEHYCVEDRS